MPGMDRCGRSGGRTGPFAWSLPLPECDEMCENDDAELARECECGCEVGVRGGGGMSTRRGGVGIEIGLPSERATSAARARVSTVPHGW